MKLNRLTIKKFIELAIKSILVIGFIFLYSYSPIPFHVKVFFENFVFDDKHPHLWLLISFFLNVLFFGGLIFGILIKHTFLKKLVKFIIKPISIIVLFYLYFYVLNKELQQIGFPLDDIKKDLWIYLFLSILFSGLFILLILFLIKKKSKNPKTKKQVQFTIYGVFALWACGFFYTRLNPYFFWNKDFHKTKTLLEMIHNELKTGKDFATIYKENQKALKYFVSIDVNAKSAGPFKLARKNFPKNFLAKSYEVFNPKTSLKIYQKRDNDSFMERSGKIINDKDVSIFVYRETVQCYLRIGDYPIGYLSCVDTTKFIKKSNY